MNVEGLTDKEGKCQYVIDGCGRYSLNVTREEYISYTKEFCFSKNSTLDIVVPLIPMEDSLAEQTKIKLCLSSDIACNDLSFHIFCPINDEIITKKNASSPNKISVSYKMADKIAAIAKIESGINEYYRICVVVEDEKLYKFSKERLDRFMQNELQARNVLLHVVVNNELKFSISPPAYMSGNIWDIGFINAIDGELMLVNTMIAKAPSSRLEWWNEFFCFYSMISRKPHIKSLFSPEKGGRKRFDDIIMEKEAFKQMMLNVMPLEDNIPEEFLKLLSQTLGDVLGNISFKMLTRLLNMQGGYACELEYSKTTSGPMKETNLKRYDFSFLKSTPSSMKKEPRSTIKKSEMNREIVQTQEINTTEKANEPHFQIQQAETKLIKDIEQD